VLYDWRRDFSRAAAELDALIEQVRKDHGDPSLRVDLVAHSSGGLVARYFLLYGRRTLDDDPAPPDFSGASKVRRVAAIGVPELGMARAAAALIEGEPVVLNRLYPEVLATSHSTFQLLPQGDDAWLLDARGQAIAADSCDPGLWRHYRMGVFDPALRARVRTQAGGRRAGRERIALLEKGFEFRLRRARQYREALRAAEVPETVAYHSIGGDCRPTQARLLLERTAGDWHARTRPEDVHWRSPDLDYQALMMQGGDGMVTRASASSTPAWPMTSTPPPRPAANWASQDFVCASHNQLVASADCQRALLRALGDD
jgi:pimeloyl-ACP methyl ester carboxylesterase